MVIGFKEQFVYKILNGTKIHTIREDKHDRWRPGMTMHMATGVRTKNYKQFHEDNCTSVQEISIFPEYEEVWLHYDKVKVRKLTDLAFLPITVFLNLAVNHYTENKK